MNEIFKKFLKYLNIRNLSIKQKFFLFSLGSLFWFMLVSAVGLITIFKMNTTSNQMVEELVPQEKVINAVIRKLRGANISVHKILLYDDKEIIKENHNRGKERLKDCRFYLTALLSGGTIKDYSISTGLLLGEFNINPLTGEKKTLVIKEVILKIEKLEKDIDEIANRSLSGEKMNLLLQKMSEYDSLTRETVSILQQFAINIYNEWKGVTDLMNRRFNVAVILVSSIFFITVILSLFFSLLMSRSLVKNIVEIIEQFKNFSSGDIQFSKKLDIDSKDEVGMLANEFNKIMDAVLDLSSFKKIIEEDETVEDIYK